MMDARLKEQYEALQAHLARHQRLIVAYSGGVDSSLVAYVAHEMLGTAALAVTSQTPSLKRSDLALAQDLAARWGLNHRVIDTDELEKPAYRANPTNRCYHCKTSLYDALAVVARAEGYAHIANGTNTDDLGDHRPGLQAADEHQVISPLVYAGFTKADVRSLATHLGLENADKPQAACLSSRFPYGSPISTARLDQVERAEAVLADLGFQQFRVRHHEEVARLEIPAQELERACQLHDTLDQRIRACGYRYVALDLGGFRSGSMNESLISVVEVEPA